jgi:NADPH:quinone reductase-like Zn-dependent oxidoreductase
MKAAILTQLGTSPIYSDFPEPVPQTDEQLIVHVKAAAVHNLDKGRASGKHYASYSNLPTVVGFDGVGTLEDGTRVYAQGLTGMMAQKAIITKKQVTTLPDTLPFSLAAALPNAIMGSAMPLVNRAKLQKGETVFINGATGVTGLLAFQLAQYYGASTLIVSGRNPHLLDQLKQAGAREIISLDQEDEAIIEQIKAIHQQTPIDVVIDYLWGKPIELLIKSITSGGIHRLPHRTRVVAVGEMAGAAIHLPSAALRSSAIELIGSGLGSFSQQDLLDYKTKFVPEIFELAAEGKIVMNIQQETLENIEKAWTQKVEAGKKMVIQIT